MQSLSPETGRLLSNCTGRSCSLTMGFCWGVWGEIQWFYRDSSWQGSFCAWVGEDWVQSPQPLLFSHFNQCSQCIAAFLNGKVCYGLFFFLWWALLFARYFEASLIPQRVVSDQEDTYQKAWKMVKNLWPKPKHGFDLETGNMPCLRTCSLYAELSCCRADTSVKTCLSNISNVLCTKANHFSSLPSAQIFSHWWCAFALHAVILPFDLGIFSIFCRGAPGQWWVQMGNI